MTRRWAEHAREARASRYTMLAIFTVAASIAVLGIRSLPETAALPTQVPARHADTNAATCDHSDREHPVGSILCAGIDLTLASGEKLTIAAAATSVVRPAVYIDSTPTQPQDVPSEPQRTAEIDVPVAISADGHRVAYLDAREHRFVGLDLRTGRTRALTPVLSAEEIGKQASLAISMDGRLFAVSLMMYPRAIVTDFDTGLTRRVPGICRVEGLNDDVLVGTRWCRERHDRLNPIVAVRRDGSESIVGGDFLAGPTTQGVYLTLSADPRNVLLHDVRTGRMTPGARLPRDFTVIGWLDEQYVLAESGAGPSRFNVRTGARQQLEGVWTFGKVV